MSTASYISNESGVDIRVAVVSYTGDVARSLVSTAAPTTGVLVRPGARVAVDELLPASAGVVDVRSCDASAVVHVDGFEPVGGLSFSELAVSQFELVPIPSKTTSSDRGGWWGCEVNGVA